MDVVSKRISLTAWGRLYGFNKATTSRLHREGKLPPGLNVEQLPNGRFYVIVPPERPPGCVLYARVSSADQRDDLDRQAGRLAEWATQQGLLPSAVVKETGSGLNGSRPKLLRVLADPKVAWLSSSNGNGSAASDLSTSKRPCGPGAVRSWWSMSTSWRTTWRGT